MVSILNSLKTLFILPKSDGEISLEENRSKSIETLWPICKAKAVPPAK
jgi:hypothetical protein